MINPLAFLSRTSILSPEVGENRCTMQIFPYISAYNAYGIWFSCSGLSEDTNKIVFSSEQMYTKLVYNQYYDR